MKKVFNLFIVIMLLIITLGCQAHNHEFVNGTCSCGERDGITFKVVFKDFDGTILKEEFVEKNNSASAPNDPKRDGYSFIGWDQDFTNILADLEVNAKYQPMEHTVSFYDFYGNLLKEEKVFTGDSATAPTLPDVPYHTFKEWDIDFSNMDSFDRKRFVRLDCLFSKAHEEKLAELQHIAYCLGAKNCTVQIQESDHHKTDSKRKIVSRDGISVKGIKANTEFHAEEHTAYRKNTERRGSSYVAFEGTQEIKQPVLKWFLHDENIKRLIEMRSNSENAVKSMILELEGSASATMSQKTALAIDGAVSKINAKSDLRMEDQATKENYSKLIFHIEF